MSERPAVSNSMDIIACIKRVPDTSEADVIKIDPSQQDIEKERLAFKINDWDEYVLEAAVQLRESAEAMWSPLAVGPPASWRGLRSRSA